MSELAEDVLDGQIDGGCVSRPSTSTENIADNAGDYRDHSRAELPQNAYKIDVKCAQEHKHGPGIYTIKDNPRGYCVIINNVIFDDDEYTRHGSETEDIRWASLFQQLGFKVSIHKDATAAKMADIFDVFSHQEDLATHNAFVAIVLSHGGPGTLSGVDGEHLRIEKILKGFNNENCEALRGKPKLFFIQACRGETRDFGVVSTTNVSDAVGPIPLTECANESIIPTWSDMMMCFSTITGHVSLRNKLSGSWFGDAMIKVMEQNAWNTEIHALMRKANQLLMSRESADTMKQSMEVVFRGWTKEFYFNPGVYEV